MGSRSVVSLALAVAASSLSSAPQGGPTPQGLDGIFARMARDAKRTGPLVAVCPMNDLPGNTLIDLGRRTTAIGGLTAVVPLKMVTVDTRFTQAPNLYEGLPRDTKMLYLLRSLSSAQWQKVTGSGLRLADCMGEQAAVFDSILPKKVRYSEGTFLDSSTIQPSATREMSEMDRNAIRLRAIRHLELVLPTADDDGYTMTSVEDAATAKGAKVPILEEEANAEFGHRVLVQSDNTPKPSQLDLISSRFDVAIPLKKGETVGELLARIGTVTGLEIVADPHYRPMAMLEAGTSATARDLLQAISLGVAGTYRRVGTMVVLTNDLEGMAAHQARLAAWEENLRTLIQEREAAWRDEIREGGGLTRVAFGSGEHDELGPEALANLALNDKYRNGDRSYIPVSQASDAIRRTLRNYTGGVKLNPEKVGISSSFRMEMVFPDGSVPYGVGSLGEAWQFDRKFRPWAPPTPKPVTLPLAVLPKLKGLSFRADTADAAQKAVGWAKALGVPEVWLETMSSGTLAAGIAAGRTVGVKISLSVRPWTLDAGAYAADPDRTVVGDHGKTLAAAKAALTPWQRLWQDLSAYEPPVRELLAPIDPAVAARTSKHAQLAATPGLGGVVLQDLYALGYARLASNSYGSYLYTPNMETFLAYGYSEGGRAAFLRARGVDPLDLEDPSVRTNVRVGEAWGETASDVQEFAKWQAAKGTWARGAASRLVKAITATDPSRPLWVVAQPAKAHVPPYASTYLFTWRPGQDLPTAPEDDYSGERIAKEADIEIIAVSDVADPEGQNRVAARVANGFTRLSKPIVLDFTSVPAGRLDAVLHRWLKPAP